MYLPAVADPICRGTLFELLGLQKSLGVLVISAT